MSKPTYHIKNKGKQLCPRCGRSFLIYNKRDMNFILPLEGVNIDEALMYEYYDEYFLRNLRVYKCLSCGYSGLRKKDLRKLKKFKGGEYEN